MPYSLTQLVGDAFKKHGIEVHFSIVDNDDTLASFAHFEGAAILSRDNDFWRYDPKPVGILKDFFISKSGQIEFKDAKEIKVPKYKYRKIISPMPKTNMVTSSFTKVHEYHFQICGSPSALTRYLGNPQDDQQVRNLRAAVYWKLGARETVDEVVATWDIKTSEVKWKEVKVDPTEKGEANALLENKSAGDIFKTVFPSTSIFRKRPV